MNPDTDLSSADLRFFVTVAGANSLAAAARELDVSRSAVTQRLRQLEERLKCVLIERSTRHLRLTEAGQIILARGQAVLDELGVTDVAVIGLAKRLEEVWVPAEPDPVIMPRQSEGLYLLQRVRDEAHRFAISYHRSKRSKRMTASALDAVRGLGESRRRALVTHFGSLARLRRASVEEITAVPGIGVATATAVLDALRAQETDHSAAPRSPVDDDALRAP